MLINDDNNDNDDEGVRILIDWKWMRFKHLLLRIIMFTYHDFQSTHHFPGKFTERPFSIQLIAYCNAPFTQVAVTVASQLNVSRLLSIAFALIESKGMRTKWHNNRPHAFCHSLFHRWSTFQNIPPRGETSTIKIKAHVNVGRTKIRRTEINRLIDFGSVSHLFINSIVFRIFRVERVEHTFVTLIWIEWNSRNSANDYSSFIKIKSTFE